MSKSENFRKSQVVSDKQMQSSSTKELDPIYQEFINLYDEFFKYLQTLDFKKLNEDVDDLDKFSSVNNTERKRFDKWDFVCEKYE